MSKHKTKIAIIGSGISGLSCAWLLNQKYDITVFEKNNYLGGHANTATINYNNHQINVDTGFIVFNFRTYPNLKSFFELLNVDIQKSNMSFGIRELSHNFEYSGANIQGLFAQKKNLFNPKFLTMLKDIIKFNRASIKIVESNDNCDYQKTLEDFIHELQLGEYFKNYYLFPMAAAIWSCPLDAIKKYPAQTFLRFFYNHGLLSIFNQPQWYTVKSGSKNYVKKISKYYADKIKLNCNIVSSMQSGDKIILSDDNNQNYAFDHVVFASHADQTYRIIADKTRDEECILSKIKYSKNTALLHKDIQQMPMSKKAWASWVYLCKKKTNQVSLSYWMNNLQNINTKYPLFVTLNPIDSIDKKHIFAQYEYEHPIFDFDAIQAQTELHSIQGARNIWFCGAWTNYGFHEDGLNSAITIAEKLKVDIPWKK